MKKTPTFPPEGSQPIESPYEASYWDRDMWERGMGADGKPTMANIEIDNQGDHVALEVMWEPVENGYLRVISLKLDAKAARDIAYTLLMIANGLDDAEEP
jgi:hypothetical protein